MIELNQKEIEAVSGGTFLLLGKIVAAKVAIATSIIGIFKPKPTPTPTPCYEPPACPPPACEPAPSDCVDTGNL